MLQTILILLIFIELGQCKLEQLNNVRTNKLDYVLNNVFLGSAVKSVEAENSADKHPVHPEKKRNFIDQYEDGVLAYLANDWETCVHEMESALSGYQDYYSAAASCRLQCEHERQQTKPMFDVDIDHLHFYEGAVRKTLCMGNCKRRLLSNVGQHFSMDTWSKGVFRTRKPYEYLQLCYFREGELMKAASATYTAILYTKTDQMMMKNLAYYMQTIENFSSSDLIDYEQKKFGQFYLDGLKAYQDEQWPAVIEQMERSLEQYQHDAAECRAFCEGEFDQGWHTDFVSSTANHFTYCLRCKQNCTREMSVLRGKVYDNLFESHYEYLQFAYYRENQIKEACKATASYLLLQPHSEDMLVNRKFYETLIGGGDDSSSTSSFFVPRIEAKEYFERSRYEQKLLEFINEKFV